MVRKDSREAILDEDNSASNIYMCLNFKSISYTIIKPLKRSLVAFERRCN